MRIVRQKLEGFSIRYPLEKIAPLEKILFVDIETTGFTARSSVLYLIGTASYEDGCWYTRQWFADSKEDECNLLISFFDYIKDFTHLIHFNGNNFDLPYLMQKVAAYKLPYTLENFTGIDIYRRVSPYKFFLHLPNCKQKTIELYLGIDRVDVYNGGELIGIYHAYAENPDERMLKILLQHNADDVKGMLEILPILSVYDMFNENHRPKKVQANYYTDINGERHQELYISFKLSTPLPQKIGYSTGAFFFSGEGLEGTLRIPLYEEEMKYFYSNYKDYYYLPEEDVALHKSIAGFVDKDHRIQATAANCYTRKYSLYLPQWDTVFEPFFKRDYKSKEYFFELTEDMKTNREFFVLYIQHVLHMLAASF